jgi:pyruvate dehydrogenase E2 component (dihydrolipoamide acetyltransferase)
MPINILMPALSPTMEKGNLAKWLKKEGDKVKPGDVIAEIETDKATMEYEAVDEGTLVKILVPEGSADVPVNQLIAVLAGEGEDVKSAAAGAGSAKPATGSAKPETKPAAAAASAPAAAAKPAPPPASWTVSPPPIAAAANGHAAAGHSVRVFASPLAKRLARDAGIDISRIAGSGPHGRIVAHDVEQAKTGGGLRAPASAQGGGMAIAPMADDKIRALYKPGTYDVVPHDSMRKTIARRLVEAKATIPHFYLTVSCNIDRLMAAREDINMVAPKGADGKPAWKVSVNDFVIKAMAMALMKVPAANVTWTEGGMLQHREADVGVAVSIPGGLITPIVRSAQSKKLTDISNEMRDLATRARNKKLKPSEYEGGTTAVSNLGMFGIHEFSAVINPPQATILAVGTGEQRPIVKDGKIEVATLMTVTLSCDHRAVDGALGAEFLGAFKSFIENPVGMVM